MRLHQTKKLLHSKANNYKNEETAYRMGESLWQLFTWEGLISKAYKELKKFKHQKKEIIHWIDGQMN
jgi:hypothetical protein